MNNETESKTEYTIHTQSDSLVVISLIVVT
jgi:hypothetical protein